MAVTSKEQVIALLVSPLLNCGKKTVITLMIAVLEELGIEVMAQLKSIQNFKSTLGSQIIDP